MSQHRQSISLSRALALLCGVTLLCTMFSAGAQAQPANKRTSVTFSQPVEIPGAGAQVLPAGTYVFRLLDSMSDRHVVQVFNADETHIYATMLTIPNYRLRSTNKTVITFTERPAGEPNALRAWFYPGDTSGQEFVYPKKRASELARLSNQPVLYLPDELAANIVAPVKSAAEPPVVALRSAPLRAVSPRGEDIEIADVIEAPPQQVARLPKTAGQVPFIALMGLVSMGVGFSLRKLCAS
jgi:hypothetical protein